MSTSNKGIRQRLWNALVFNAMATYGDICYRDLLRKSARANKVSERLLMRLVRKNRNTEFGKAHHFSEIHSLEDYQRLVPMTTYDDYRDYVERTAQTGEQGLITTDTIDYFAVTSGTVGEMKRIPVVRRAYMPYARMGCMVVSLVRQLMRQRGLGCMDGRGLNLVESSTPNYSGVIRQGYISSYAVNNFSAFASAITSSPVEMIREGVESGGKYLHIRYALQDKDITFMMAAFLSAITDLMAYMVENADMLIQDIETGTIDPSVKLDAGLRQELQRNLRPDPKRAQELREIFSSPEEGPLVPRIWKRMVLVVGIGSGEFAPYVEKMRAYTGNDIAFFHSIYGASEALIGQAMWTDDDRYMLLPDGGFYEFLPVEGDGQRPLTIGELKEGEAYELVLTNLAGLYRYRIRDVVRVAGFEGETPYLHFAYRDQQMVNIAGVHLTAEHFTAVMREVQQKFGMVVADYSLYVDDDYAPARVVLFIEPEGDPAPQTVEALVQGIDKIIGSVNPDFSDLVEERHISPTVVHLLPEGTCREFRNQKTESGAVVNQIKAVRLLRTAEQLELFMQAANACPLVGASA